MTPISPKTIASPTDMIRRMELRLMPRNSVSIAVDHTSPRFDALDGGSGRLRDGLLLLGSHLPQRPAWTNSFNAGNGILAAQLSQVFVAARASAA